MSPEPHTSFPGRVDDSAGIDGAIETKAQSEIHVQLADRVVLLSDLRQYPDRYAGLFGRARGEVGYGICLCRSDEIVRLVIRCRFGRYHLATWPDGSHQHAPGCVWYRSHPSLSGRTDFVEAITTNDTGTSIRLSIPLAVQGDTVASTKTTPPAPSEPGTTTGRRAMGPLALLHWLWETAQLNVWHPARGQRSWRHCRALLVEVVRECRVNRRALADALWIVPAYRKEAAKDINAGWDRFLDRLTNTGRTRHRGLLLGEIRAIEETNYGVRIRLGHQRAALYTSEQLMIRAKRSYPSVFSDSGAQLTRRRVVLCVVERSRGGYPVIVDFAAMLTTGSYVPADSSYEVRMADALEAAGRAFVKPLRYGGGDVFPDFVLVDNDPPTYVEVWGVRGRERYETRKRIKQSLYHDSGRSLIEWDVSSPLPDLSR